MSMSSENTHNGNFFEIEIFILKHVFHYSESTPIKQNFRLKFLSWPFHRHMKSHFSKKWLCPKSKVIIKIFWNRYFHSQMYLVHSQSIPTKTKFFERKYLCLLFFDQKWPKLEEIFGRYKFLQKKLYPLMELFIAVLLSHHLHVYL